MKRLAIQKDFKAWRKTQKGILRWPRQVEVYVNRAYRQGRLDQANRCLELVKS